jgi:hypothetical protein
LGKVWLLLSFSAARRQEGVLMRENQGLQLAVIMFASLTVVLCVSTYIYFQKHHDEQSRAERLAERVAELQTQNDQLVSDVQAIKAVVTDRAAATVAEVQADHQRDARHVHPEISPPAMPTYQRLVGHLLNAVSSVVERELRVRSDLLAAREDLTKQRHLHEAEVAVIDRASAAREAEITVERAEHRQARADMVKNADRMLARAERQSAEIAAQRVRFDEMQQALSGEIDATKRQYEIVRNHWEELQPDHFEQPHGQITYADARTRAVVIDLGSGDFLRRGVTFQVYDEQTPTLAGAKPKGTIEITRIVDEKSAEGKITADAISNPILAGDLIHTPLWQPGRQRTFALAGLLDLDGDGGDDADDVRSLIERWGGTIEASVDANGVLTGKLTAETRYVVVGQRPAAPKREAEGAAGLNAYDDLLAQAHELGIDQISLSKLLDLVEFQQGKVVRANRRRP